MNRQTGCVLLLTTGLALVHGRLDAGQTAAAQKEPRTVDAPAAPAASGKSDAASGQSQDTSSKPEETAAQAGDGQAPAAGDAKLTVVPGSKALGMSILGNQEAPKSLVIVPWKTSELGGSPGVSLLLDDSRQPVDRDVFMRSLRYHELSSGTAHPGDATTGSREHAAATSGATPSTASHGR
jgi:hypothetical protein